MENKPSSLAKNTIYSAVSSFSNVLMVVIVIVAARILGDKAFGEFSFALAIATIFEMFIDLGFFTLITRNVARDKQLTDTYLSNILGWKLILSVAAMALMVVTINLLDSSPEARTASYIMGGSIILRTYKTTSQAFFQAYERFDLVVLTMYVERIGTLICCIGVLFLAKNVIAFSAAFAFWRIPDMVFAYWLLHKKVAPVRITLNRSIIKEIQLAALPFATYSIIMAIYNYIATLILTSTRSSEEVGWYNAGYKIYEGLYMFPYLLSVVILPRLSKIYMENTDAHVSLANKVLRYQVIAVLPITITIGILAPQIIMLLFGKSYMPGVTPLRIMLAAAIFLFVNFILNTILISANREKIVLRTAVIGLIIMITSNAILVSGHGAMGAAYSVVISEISMHIILIYEMRRSLFKVPVSAFIWRPLLAGGLVFGILYLSIPSEPVIFGVLFALLYTISMFALRAFDKDDISLLRSLIPSRRETSK
ncbi:MAG: flippase [Armatimonadota bacterium]